MSLHKRIFWRTAAGLTCLFVMSAAPALGATITFPGGAEVQTDTGYFTLSWQSDAPEGTTFTVDQSTDPEFSPDATRSIDVGTSKSQFFSGLRDGQYYFQVRAVETISEPVQVSVTHFDTTTAVLLLVLGAITFTGVLFVVVRGAPRP